MIALALAIGFLAGLVVLYVGCRWHAAAGVVAAVVAGASSIGLFYGLSDQAGADWLKGFGIGLALSVVTMRSLIVRLVAKGQQQTAAGPPATPGRTGDLQGLDSAEQGSGSRPSRS